MVVLPPPPTVGYKLYSPAQVTLAAFLGSPLSACWFFAANYRALGNAAAANRCLGWGALGTALLVALGFVLPQEIRSVIPVASVVMVSQAARQAQGAAVEAHRAAGGRLGSWWAVIGVSLLALAVILGLVFAGAVAWVLLSPGPKGAA